MIWVAVICAFAHIALCAVVILAAGSRLIRIRPVALLMMTGVPIFGPMSMMMLGINKRIKKDGSSDIEVDKFKVETEIYRSMGMPVDEDHEVVTLEEAMIMNNSQVRRTLMMDLIKENVVPLEEALTVSAPSVRRKLMMDILTSDAFAFYNLMEQARLNDDVEVVHYATTAMTELNKKYDTTLQKYREKHRSDPENVEALSLYCDCLDQYLALGFVKGRIEQNRRREFIECLEVLTKRAPTLLRYEQLVRQYLRLERYEEAARALRNIEALWPTSSNYWMLCVEYYVRRKDTQALRTTLRVAASNGIYFNSESKEKLQFWLGNAVPQNH